MSSTRLLKLNAPRRSITWAAMICSEIGGQTSILTPPHIPMRLFLSSRISSDTLTTCASGKFLPCFPCNDQVQEHHTWSLLVSWHFQWWVHPLSMNGRDFYIACQLEDNAYTKLCDLLDKNWQVPMSRYDMMKHFNVIGISQSHTHISILSKIYLNMVFNNDGWNNITPTSLSMNRSNELVWAVDFFCLHVTIITFPAVPLSCGSIHDLLLVPRHPSGARGGGGLVFPAGSQDFPQPC
jgi:hypothetical protein